MVVEQSVTMAIIEAVIEATRASIMAVRETDNPVNNTKLTFHWKAEDRYKEL